MGADGRAEAVAQFIRNRPDPGSYHDLVDSDSHINLVEWSDEAFHDATGTNPHSYGLSFATNAADWRRLPTRWVDGAIRQGARRAAAYATWVKARNGTVIPPVIVSAADARRGRPGFVTHAALDPARRSDPGAGFPFTQFFAEYVLALSPEDDDMTPEDRKLLTAIADEQRKTNELLDKLYDQFKGSRPVRAVFGDILDALKKT